jgi:hypothetical protein
MSLVITRPPPRPTLDRPDKYYTLHSKPNDAFTLKMPYMKRTSIVGFKQWDDALHIGKMIETYFIHNKDWPDTQSDSLFLPNSQLGERDLEHIYIQMWEFEELKVECTKNMLDMISVEEIMSKNSSAFSLAGDMITFNAPDEFYRLRFEELLTSSEEG